MNKTIKFESLKIETPGWGEDKGKLVTKLSLSGKKSDMTLILPDEVGQKILELAKHAIIDAVEESANDFIFELTTAINEIPKLGGGEA